MFSLKTPVVENTSAENVEFMVEVDLDGDLAIRANGILVAYINHETKRLHLLETDTDDIAQLPGLEFADGYLQLYRS